ncbi:unnamed protein product [Urochloa decumbens]|uniref:Bowman-Birk serine protease inhibitors family domain-containing protein n=1 Tax=Urochloa decumbens TaxID=240449 RepID=A0ABC9CVP6_9POAL
MGTAPAVILATMLVVGLATAAAAATNSGTDTTTIRLPATSSVVGDSNGGNNNAPWDCCDFVVRDPSFRPARWQCNDVKGECSADCHDCEESLAGDGYVCRDWVASVHEPPVCTPRPWDCCDFAVCTRAYIPTCWCADKVESCSGHCKDCEALQDYKPHRYRCLDRFVGYPGPKCTPWSSKDDDN